MLRKRVALLVLALLVYGGCTGRQGPAGPAGVAGSQGPQGPNGSLGIYGDGSAGASVIAANTTWTNQSNRQFTDFTVNNGVTLTVPSGTVIRCTGTFTNNGTITVKTGAFPGSSNGNFAGNIGIYVEGQPAAGVAAAPAANGDHMVSGGWALGGWGGVGLSYGEAQQLLALGSSGGGGGGVTLIGGWYNQVTADGVDFGEGGGAFTVLALGSLTNGGTIAADGITGYDGSETFGNGGGGGGVVILASKTSINNTGLVSAKGGPGAPGVAAPGVATATTEDVGPGGGGGGGIIHLLAPTVTAGTTSVAGGTAGVVTGTPAGTHYAGGAGGGACGGSGGNGASVSSTSFGIAKPGGAGFTVVDQVDPTDVFWP